MLQAMCLARRARIAAAIVAALAVAACANRPNELDCRNGAVPPRPAASRISWRMSAIVCSSNPNSTDLTPQSRITLDKQAQWLSNYNRYSFTIEGHADERGTREYNIALGARRAQAVRDYLASRGIELARMRTISYGKERPVAICNDISCWSQNRRAVTVLNASS